MILSIADIRKEHKTRVGGKAFALAEMFQNGMPVPFAMCITTDAYAAYLGHTGLQERIALELHRKRFEDMRWEELWDMALRIQNMFLKTPIPADLKQEIEDPLASAFSSKPTAVRSSAPGEDSAAASFAGLHESYVNIKGPEAILEHVKLVWASLWSDRALLYRQEVGLDVKKSAMAVVLQEMVFGDRSGVAFGKNPTDAAQAVIEAVHGLNQGLVDGMVEPDRWIIDRKTRKTISHQPAQRDEAMFPAGKRVRLQPLPPARRMRPPVNDNEIAQVVALVLQAETFFGSPQDVEWTFFDDRLHVLQSRPITTTTGPGDDERSWYLSLHRSFENLKALRTRIEETLLPAMDNEAQGLSQQPLEKLSDIDLAEEIQHRSDIYEKWSKTYWDEFIPMAHGMRLFGEVYNRMVRPDDPYEFMRLLGASDMLSVRRNNMLAEMASAIRKHPDLAATWDRDTPSAEQAAFRRDLDDYLERFGDLACGKDQCRQGHEGLIRLLQEMAAHETAVSSGPTADAGVLTKAFLDRFTTDDRPFGDEVLALGRASYQLRDDDNIYLSRIRSQMTGALDEGRHRIEKRFSAATGQPAAEDVIAALKDPAYIPKPSQPVAQAPESRPQGRLMKARQLTGQPAGPGIAKGKARVVENTSQLNDFKAGEVLVCDALDPTMTFVVPLAAGIVERRGGMLIHGAIIAREYGLPCVTGVPEVTDHVTTGDTISVDGYLGIVTIHADPPIA